jgi:hypothetical protein
MLSKQCQRIGGVMRLLRGAAGIVADRRSATAVSWNAATLAGSATKRGHSPEESASEKRAVD